MRHIIFFMLAAAITAASIHSCGMISINDSGYKRLSPKEKAHIKKCTTSIDSLAADSNIYQITVAQMQEYLSHRNDVIIYEYATYCHSAFCINPIAAQQICREHGYGFCLLIDTYDYLERIPAMNVPILAIDQTPYDTDKTPKYCNGFFNALTGVTDKVRGYGRFLHFHQGRFIKAYNDIREAFGSSQTHCFSLDVSQ